MIYNILQEQFLVSITKQVPPLYSSLSDLMLINSNLEHNHNLTFLI